MKSDVMFQSSTEALPEKLSYLMYDCSKYELTGEA